MKESLIILIVLALLSTAITQEPITGTCLRFSVDGESCLQCKSHFHLFQGSCYVDIHGCLDYVFGNICRRCQAGYILVNNECCDKHCMAKIFKNYQHEIITAQITQEQELQKISLQGYEKAATTISKMLFKNTQAFEITSTRNQKLLKVIRYFLDVNAGGRFYKAILDYKYQKGTIELIEYIDAASFSQITQKVLTENDLETNKKAIEGLKFVNTQFGTKVYGFILSRLSSITYSYGSQMKFIYTGEKKVIIIQIQVNNQLKPYTIWLQQKTNVVQIKALLEQIKKDQQYQKQTSFIAIWSHIAEQSNVAVANIKVKNITKISESEYSFTYINAVTNEKFEYHAQYNFQSKAVVVISSKVVVKKSVQQIGLPILPQVQILRKEQSIDNEVVKRCSGYLETIKPSFNILAIETTKIEKFESNTKVSIVSTVDGKKIRNVILIDTASNQITLIDQSLVQVTQKNKIFIEKLNEDSTVTITTNSLEELEQSDNHVRYVFEHLEKSFSDKVYGQIVTIQSTEGSISTEYTFITQVAKKAEKQVTVSYNKQTKVTKIIDYKQIPQKETLIKPLPLPVMTLTKEEIHKKEIREVVSFISQTNVEMLGQIDVTSVNSVQQIKTELGIKYKMEVKNSQGRAVNVIVSKVDSSDKLLIEDVRYAKQVEVKKKVTTQVSSQTNVNVVTGVKTEWKVSSPTNLTSQLIYKPAIIASNECQPVGIQERQYIGTLEQVVNSKCKNSTAITTVIVVDKVTNQATILKQSKIDIGVVYQPPMIPEIIIPSTNFKSQIKVHTQIKTAVDVVVKQNPVLAGVTPVNTIVENFTENVKVTLMYETQGKTQRVVSIVNKQTKQVKIVQDIKIEAIKPVTLITNTTVDGKTVVISNSVEQIRKYTPSIDVVIDNIKIKNPEVVIEEIQTIQTVDLSMTTQVSIVAGTSTGIVEQISVSVVKSTNEVKYTNVQVIEVQETLIKPIPIPSFPVEPNSPQIITILPIIEEEHTSIVGTGIVITSASTQTNTAGTVVTMKIKNDVNQEFSIKVQQQTETGATIITDVRPIGGTVQVVQNLVHKGTVEVSVSAVTGIKTQFTSSANITSELTFNTTKVIPKSCVPVGVQRRYFARVEQDIVQSRCIDGSAIQTIVLIDKQTKQVKVINEQQIKIGVVDVAPVINEQIITSTQFKSTIKTNTGLSSAIKLVVQTNPVLVNVIPTSTVIESFDNFTMQTMIFNVEGTQKRVVTMVNTVDHKVTIVQDIKLTEQIKAVTVITKTQEDGKVVVISNSIKQIVKVNENATIAITAIKTQFPQIVTNQISTIQSIDLTLTSQIKVIAETKKGITQQISVSVVKQTGQVRITDVQVISQQQVIVLPKPLPIIEIEPTNPDIITTIPIIEQQQSQIIGTGITVVSATSQTNIIGSVITMQVTNSKQQTYSVTVQKEVTTGTTTIIDVRPIGQFQQAIQVQIQESSTSVNVDMITGIKSEFTVSTDLTSQLTYIPQVVVTKECVPVAIQKRIYTSGNSIQQTIQSVCKNQTAVSTTVIINQSTNITKVIDEHVISITDSVIAPVVPEIVIAQAEFTSQLSSNVILQTTVNHITKANTVLTGLTPVTTIIDTYKEQIKTTLVYKVQEKTQTVIAITNTQTKKVTILEDIKINVIKPVSVITNKTSQGKTVVISNSIEQIKTVNVHIEKAITSITTQFPQITTQNIQTIQSTNLSLTSQVTIIAQVSVGVQQQITATINTQTGAVTIIDAQILPPTMIQPIRPPTIIIPPIDFVKPEIIEIVSAIKIQQASVIGKQSTVVDIKSQIHQNAILYTAVMQSQSKVNFTVKVQKDIKTGNIQINDIREVKKQIVSEVSVKTQASITVTKVDKHTGVTVVQTNDQSVITSSSQTTAVIDFISQAETQFDISDCLVKAIQTRDYDSQMQQTVLYACANAHGIQVTVLIEKVTQKMVVIGHLETTLDITNEQNILPVIHENTISEVTYSSFVKTDLSLQATVSSVIATNVEFSGLIPEVTFEQDLHLTKKYTFVFNVNGKKERVVAIYNSQNDIKVVQKIEIPVVIEPVVSIIKTGAKGQVTKITNSVSQVRKVDIHVDQVIEQIKHTYSFVSQASIQGIQTVSMSGATQYTILVKNQFNKEQQITVTYQHKTQAITIIDDQVIPRVADQFIVPLPAPIRQIDATQLSSTQIVQMTTYLASQTPSPFGIGTQVLSATAMTISFGMRYQLTLRAQTGVTYVVNIDKNTQTGQLVIVDVAKPLEGLPVLTEVIVDQVTGVTKTITSSKVAIQMNTQYSKIRDFLLEKHTQLQVGWELQSSVQIPYMRSTEETYIFRKGDRVIQSTVLVDKRNKQIIEIDYQNFVEKLTPGVIELPKRHPQIHIVQKQFTRVAQTNTIVKTCIEFASKTDFTLKGKIPAETVLEDFSLIKKVTFIFKTQTKTDRIVIIYDVQAKTTKVIDLGVVQKDIVNSKTVIKNDIKGNVVVTTSNIAQVTEFNPRFSTIVRNITTHQQYLSEFQIKTVTMSYRKVSQEKIRVGTTVFGTSTSQSTNLVPGVQIGDLFEGQITFVNTAGILVQIGFDTGLHVGGQISITTIQETSLENKICVIKKVEYMQTTITSEQLATSTVVAELATAIKIESTVEIGTQFTVTQVVQKDHPMNHIYQVSITTQAGVQMIVTVDKNIDTGSFVIINIQKEQQTQVIVQQVKQVITEVKVDINTGVKTTITNDIKQIKKTQVRVHAIDTIIESRTELRTYTVQSIVQKQYQTHIEETVLFVNKNNVASQVTVSINKNTNVVTEIGYVTPVINVQQPYILPVIHQETLTQSQFEIAVTTDVNLQSSLQVIHQTHTQLTGVQPIVTIIDSMQSSVQTTFVFEYKNKKERIVTVKLEGSTTATIVQDIVTIPAVIKPVTSTVKVDVQTGLEVRISNDVSVVREYQSNIQEIINDIKIKVPSINTEQIEYIQTTELTSGSQVVIISEAAGVSVQVQVSVNANGQVHIIDVIKQPVKPIISPPVIQPPITILPGDYEKPEIVSVIQTAISQQTQFTFAAQPEIISIVKKPFTFSNQVIIQMKTQSGLKVNITVQTDKKGQNVVIVDVRQSKAITTATTQSQTYIESKVQVEVSAITGVKTNFTSNTNVISQLEWKQQVFVTKECVPLSLQETIYTTSVQQTVQAKCRNGTAFQQTVIVNTKTQQVIVIDHHEISITEIGVAPVISEVLITQHNFQTAIKTNTQLQVATQVVIQSQSSLVGVNPVNTIIEQHQGGSVITFMYQVKGQTQRIVTVYNQSTKQVTIIEDVKITQQIQAVTIITDVSSTGIITTTSNSIETISQIDTSVNIAITTVTQQFSEIKVQSISSVSVTTLTGVSQFTFVAETTTGYTQQISVSVIKETGAVVVTNVQIIGSGQIIVQPVPLPIIEVSPTAPVVVQIVNTIESSTQLSSQLGVNIEVIEVYQQTSTIASSFEVTIENQQNEQFVVTVEQNTQTGALVIVDTRATKIVTVQAQEIQESTTEVNVNVVTGIKKEWIVSSEIDTQIYVKPEIILSQQCQAVGVETRQYIGFWQQTVKSKCKNSTAIQTSIIVDKQTYQTITLSENIISINDVALAPIIPQVIIPKHNFEVTIKKDTSLQVVVDFVKVQNPTLVGEIPISTVIETHQEIKKVTMIFEIKKQKERVVSIYNPNVENTVEIIEQVKIQGQITGISVISTTNSIGQTVVVSNSIEQIRKVTQQVDIAIQTITQTYQQIQIEKISTIQTTQLTGSTEFTFIAESSTGVIEQISASVITSTGVVVITNAQILPVNNTVIRPVPLPVIQVEPTSPIVAQIQIAIQANAEVTSVLQSSSINVVSVTEQISSTGSTYQLTVTTETQSQYTVIVQQQVSTGQITVVDVRPSVQVQVVEISVSQVSVSVNVDATTGVSVNWTVSENITTDQLVFVPELPQGSVIGGVQTIEYQQFTEQTIVAQYQNGSGVQITAIVNTQTSQVLIVNEQVVETITPGVITHPVVSEIIITQEKFESSLKVDTTLQTIVQTVHTQNTQLTTIVPVNTIIQEIGTSVKATLIYQVHGQTERVVVVYNSTSEQKPIIIEDVTFTQPIKSITFINTTTQTGTNVMITNDIKTAIKADAKVQIVVEQIKVKYPQISIENIQTIESSDLSASVQYTFVAQTAVGVEQVEATLVKQTNEIRITNVQTLDINMQEPVITQPAVLPIIQVLPEQFTAVQYKNIIDFVQKTQSTVQHSQVVQITTQESNFNTHYEVKLKTQTGQIIKVGVNQDKQTALPEISNVAPVIPDFVPLPPLIIEQTCDAITAVKSTVYSSEVSFKRDVNYNMVTEFIETNVEAVAGYEVVSAVKQVFGANHEYHILYKTESQSPEQVTIVVNTLNNQISILQEKKLTDTQIEVDLLTPVIPQPEQITLTNLEKENIKILSQIGNIPEIPEYNQVSDLITLQKDQVFIEAANIVKAQYAILLKDAIIVKVMEKQSLNKQMKKLFYKVNDQIYQADIEINGVTNDIKVIDFSKVGSTQQSSSINIDVDLAYGYEQIKDFKADKNIEFLINYIREKYTNTLEGAVVKSAEKLLLANGRVNYKIYFKSDLQTIKFIVYYEPIFKRVLEVRSYPFETGKGFAQISLQNLVTDPYFKKVDSYIKEKHQSQVSDCEVLKVENKDIGSKIIFRTVYSCGENTYHSRAYIVKESNLVEEQAWNEIIEVPTATQSISVENSIIYKPTKLDPMTVNQNIYVSTTKQYVLKKYAIELKGATLKHVSVLTNAFTVDTGFIFVNSANDEQFEIKASYAPLTQNIQIVTPLKKVNILEGYSAIGNQQQFLQLLDWLKEKNSQLATAVVVESGEKALMFGNAYRVIFKTSVKYYEYIVAIEDNTKRILYQRDYTQFSKSTSKTSFISSQTYQKTGTIFPTPQIQPAVISGTAPIIVSDSSSSNLLGGSMTTSAFNTNCLTSDVNGNCSRCKDGYHLFENKCFTYVKNCQVYYGPSTCKQCNSGFKLQNNSCIAV